MPKTQPQIRVGISGWTYAPWRGVFYPKDLAHKRELEYASRVLNSIEINGTFYSLQRPSSFQAWYDATPDNFMFSLKGSRFITHMRRLKEVEQPLANYFASGILGLKEKLGPILWQFPPNFKFDAAKLEAFFKLLPKDTTEAARLAGKHDGRVKGTPLTETDRQRPMRYAVEIRNPTFENESFVTLLRNHNIALVFADTAGKWSFTEDITADFVYARLHGDEELYASGYSDAALDWWAKRFCAWSAGKEPSDARHWSVKSPVKRKSRDLFIYFDNDVKVRAPFDAMSLARRLGENAQGEAVVGKDPPAAAKLSKEALAQRVRSHWPGRAMKK